MTTVEKVVKRPYQKVANEFRKCSHKVDEVLQALRGRLLVLGWDNILVRHFVAYSVENDENVRWRPARGSFGISHRVEPLHALLRSREGRGRVLGRLGRRESTMVKVGLQEAVAYVVVVVNLLFSTKTNKARRTL
ncbi:hypothetical protein K435DRAFT_793134 [Dendrothele bispora CBS 962.96]|uniref:Uncharacterized protein n=1 Tax=Dendrothele bispora (strain CBS 962.96) TaxID=1314807 RepID=A0A4S8MG85_DENBC|nr:hypothetical protein K435DRAFT_793134 [Dendrothele bispora CBS 962.96]